MIHDLLIYSLGVATPFVALFLFIVFTDDTPEMPDQSNG
jgi:hypothetical protein